MMSPAVKLSAQRKAYLNAHIIAPAQGLNGRGGILVEDGWILAVGPKVTKESIGAGTASIDSTGATLIPGLIDMRVFTGEPGTEYRETLASASEAAAAGGVTTMIVMPNTQPVIDDAAIVDFILRRARDTALVRVAPMAAITKGLAGELMSEIGSLKEAGAVAVTDGTHAVSNANLFRRALTYAKDFDMLVVQHVEEPSLSKGVMNASESASRLGLVGNPAMSEVIMLERDIRLVELTGARYHAAQISCATSLEVIRGAKAKGLPVTCGVSIHHLTLNENDIGAYRTFFKLSPPLRSEDDRRALVGIGADEFAFVGVEVAAHRRIDAFGIASVDPPDGPARGLRVVGTNPEAAIHPGGQIERVVVDGAEAAERQPQGALARELLPFRRADQAVLETRMPHVPVAEKPGPVTLARRGRRGRKRRGAAGGEQCKTLAARQSRRCCHQNLRFRRLS